MTFFLATDQAGTGAAWGPMFTLGLADEPPAHVWLIPAQGQLCGDVAQSRPNGLETAELSVRSCRYRKIKARIDSLPA